MSSKRRAPWGHVLTLGITILCAMTIVPVVASAAEKVVYVKVNVANVRSGAGTEHEVAFEVKYGDKLVVLDGGDSWSHIRVDGTMQEGWIFTPLTSKDKPPEGGGGAEPPLRTTSEIAPGYYDSKTDEPAPVAEISLFGREGGLAPRMDESPMFENARHVFVGDMKVFVGATSADGQSKVISAAHPRYDPLANMNPSLSDVGVVYLDDKGIVKGDNAKSGWVNMAAWGKYTKPATGKSQDVKLTGVSFWVNRGGKNWWDFEVRGAVLEGEYGRSLEISTNIEALPAGTKRPVIVVDGKYRLIPQINSLQEITFVEEKR